MSLYHFWIILLFFFLHLNASAKDWKDKSVGEYSEADYDNLYEEWEENDDDIIPPDELPYGHPDRPKPPVSYDNMDMSDPQSMMRASKANKAAMLLVTVNEDPTKEETEDLTLLWEMGLYNNQIHASRFLIDDDRMMFTLNDGATAFEVKDYLIEQERVEIVEIDEEIFQGKFSKQGKKSEL